MKFNIVLLIILLVFIGFIVKTNQQLEYPVSRGEQLVNTMLANGAKTIKEKYNLKPSGTGAAMPGGPIKELTLCFHTKHTYTKEQLRELLIKSAQEFLNQINSNDEIQEFLIERPFTIKNVEIIIYNQDKNGKSVRDPEISTARISQSALIYRAIDPEDSFKYKNQYEESYEEALKILSTH